MAPGTPIQLTLYGANDEVVSTHSRSIITTRFLERAIDLADAMKEIEKPKEMLQALDQFLVDFFGGQFTLDQVKDGGDLGEKMTVLYAILNRAGGMVPSGPAGATMPNPPKPGRSPRRKRGNGL